jgi:hypothetical protein
LGIMARRAAAWGERVLEHCAGAAERHWLPGLVLFTAVYAVSTIARSRMKPLWFDELFTLYISRLSSFQERLPVAVYDGHPPLFYAITHASMRLFGESGLAVRLPEMIGVWLMCVSLFFFTRRRCPAIYAFLALVLPLQTLAYSYAIEARPYGIVLGMAGLSLLAWQSAGEARPRLAWLALLAASLAAGVSSHFFGVQIVLPLLVGEALRAWERRSVDWGVAAAMGLGVLPVPFLLSVARGIVTAQFSPTKLPVHFAASPSLPTLPAFYEDLLEPLVVPFAIVFVVLALRSLVRAEGSAREEPARRRMPLPESAALVTYLFVPACVLIGTAWTTDYFQARYAISAVIGAAVLFPCMLYAGCGKRALVPLALTASVLLVWAGHTVSPPPQVSSRPAELTLDSPLYPKQDDLPIAVGGSGEFPPLAHYSPPAVVARLYCLIDLPYSRRTYRPVGETSLSGARQVMPGHVVDYGPFVRTHAKFWVYAGYPSSLGWLPSRLLAEGWRLECKAQQGKNFLFLAERE